MDDNGNFGKLVVDVTEANSCYDFGSVEKYFGHHYPAYKEMMMYTASAIISNQSPVLNQEAMDRKVVACSQKSTWIIKRRRLTAFNHGSMYGKMI